MSEVCQPPCHAMPRVHVSGSMPLSGVSSIGFNTNVVSIPMLNRDHPVTDPNHRIQRVTNQPAMQSEARFRVKAARKPA